jgi:hypothetical protein
MNRLSLDAFKEQVRETQELENLTGGILGACHGCIDCGSSTEHIAKIHNIMGGFQLA